MADFYIGQGDTGPILEVVPLMPDGYPADITGASLLFYIAPYGADLGSAPGSPVTLLPDPVEPRIQHGWLTAETLVAGTFCFQIRGTLSDGRRYTFPTERPYYTVEIYPQV